MKLRLLVVILAAGMLAFAPAPLPRRQRIVVADGLSIAALVGTWNVVKLQSSNGTGGLNDAGTYLKEVRIENNRWTFFYREANKAGVNYGLRIDADKKPAEIDFYQGNAIAGQPYGTGLIRRDGDRLTVVYHWGGTRPTSFEKPAAGNWVITLQRVR